MKQLNKSLGRTSLSVRSPKLTSRLWRKLAEEIRERLATLKMLWLLKSSAYCLPCKDIAAGLILKLGMPWYPAHEPLIPLSAGRMQLMVRTMSDSGDNMTELDHDGEHELVEKIYSLRPNYSSAVFW
jgi:hypothetical protein